MRLASILLVMLLVTVPFSALMRSDWWLAVQLVLAAVGVLTAVGDVASSEGAHWLRVVRPILWMAGPALAFVAVQILPMPFLAHPVWASAAEALRTPLAGHASVDLGASVTAFAHILLWTLVACLASATLIDRWRAEGALAALAGVASLTAILCRILSEPDTRGASIDAALVGLLAAASFAYLAFERWETRHARQAHAVQRLVVAMGGAMLAIVISGSVLASGNAACLSAAGGGLVLLAGIIVIRRLGLGAYVSGFIGLLALGFCGIALARTLPPDTSVTLGFSDAPRDMIDWTVRMMADLPGLGTGAGTADALSGLYQSFETEAPYHVPSTAAALDIEIGRAGSIGLAGLTLFAIGLLIRDAFRRGRDSIYPTFGAALVLALGLATFIDAGLRNDGICLLVAVALGLAFAQSQSRHA